MIFLKCFGSGWKFSSTHLPQMGEKYHLEQLNINQLVNYSISISEVQCLTM